MDDDEKRSFGRFGSQTSYGTTSAPNPFGSPRESELEDVEYDDRRRDEERAEEDEFEEERRGGSVGESLSLFSFFF